MFSKLASQVVGDFDKDAFVRQCLQESPDIRNVEIERKASELGHTISPGYISDIRKAFLCT